MVDCVDARQGQDWVAYHGDCVPVCRQLPDQSVGFSIYSIPFLNLFTYSEYAADLGNCATEEEFFTQYRYLITEQMRIMKPGRLIAVHCSHLPFTKARDGVIAINPFAHKVCDEHRALGMELHSEVTIWKDPVIEMTRTKALGLLYMQFKKDSTRCRQGMADYLLVFRVPGVNVEPVGQDEEKFPVEVWQQWASPVWMDIRQTNTLNVVQAKRDADSKHLCPLQLDLIERSVYMWSNPGDVVLSPFMGVGSEGYVALKLKRKFVGVELADHYFASACRNLADAERNAPTIFDDLVA